MPPPGLWVVGTLRAEGTGGKSNSCQVHRTKASAVVAYDRLIGEWFITARVGAGTFVSDSLPVADHRTGATGGILRPRPVWDNLTPPMVERDAEFDFRPGIPTPGCSPTRAGGGCWRRCTGHATSGSSIS